MFWVGFGIVTSLVGLVDWVTRKVLVPPDLIENLNFTFYIYVLNNRVLLSSDGIGKCRILSTSKSGIRLGGFNRALWVANTEILLAGFSRISSASVTRIGSVIQ